MENMEQSYWRKIWVMPWYAKGEYLVFLLAGGTYYIATLGIPVFGSAVKIRDGLIRVSVVFSLVIIFLIWRIGIKNFRFKVSMHALVLVFVSNSASAILKSPEGEPFPKEYLGIFLAVLILHVIVGVSAIYGIFNTLQPFSAELNNLREKIKHGNYYARISNDVILKDSVLGENARTINDILDITATLVNTIATSTNIISSTVENLGGNTEELNASVEEVTASTQSMAQGASSQSEMLFEMTRKQEEGEKLVKQIIEQIQKNASQVSEISIQTNILALNAGIEASRAGDYGRGFSVVAENVRRLAESSSTLADQIKETAEEVTKTLERYFQETRSDIEQIATISEETSASSEEIAATMEDVNANLVGMTELTNELMNLVQENQKILKTFLKD